MKNILNKKIIIALSGGVDSAVGAALLKKQGFQVIGVHFRFFGPTWTSEVQVKKIAEKLGIPLKIIDARKEFRKRVVDYFVNAYRKGLTPNPCVICNKEIKFRLLFDFMKKMKADYVATGHYARIHITHNMEHITRKKLLRVTSYVLREAKDKTKDQSYFLHRLTREELAKIIFPLGNYKKSEVKKIARKMKLPISKEKESQDVCFLIGKPINDFLRNRIKTSLGDIIMADRVARTSVLCRFKHTHKSAQFFSFEGRDKVILGRHEGLPFYTIGQRKGIRIGGTGPYFVVGKDVRKNELIVTDDPGKLLTRKFQISGVNWISPAIKFPLSAKVQIRYHAPKVGAIIRGARPAFAKASAGKGGIYLVKTEKKLRAVTPGQSAVFYKGGEVLGGGIII